jgi:hypothetical protein
MTDEITSSKTFICIGLWIYLDEMTKIRTRTLLEKDDLRVIFMLPVQYAASFIYVSDTGLEVTELSGAHAF